MVSVPAPRLFQYSAWDSLSQCSDNGASYIVLRPETQILDLYSTLVALIIAAFSSDVFLVFFGSHHRTISALKSPERAREKRREKEGYLGWPSKGDGRKRAHMNYWNMDAGIFGKTRQEGPAMWTVD